MTESAPLLSVIVPVFRTERYLDACLRSLRAQTLSSLEVIVVNDASPDASQRIIDRYCDRDPRFEALLLERNRGPSAARNAGLEIAQGKYIAFLDSDDLLPASAYETLVRAAEESQSELCVGVAETFSQRSRWINTQMQEILATGPASGRADDFPVLARDASPCNKVFRRDLIEAHGLRFPVGIDVREDLHFVARAYAAAERVRILPDIVYLYRVRAEQANASLTQQVSPKIVQDLVRVARELEGLLRTRMGPPFMDALHVGLLSGMLYRLRPLLRGHATEDASELFTSLRAHLESLDELVNLVSEPEDRLLLHLLRMGDLPGARYLVSQGVDEVFVDHVSEQKGFALASLSEALSRAQLKQSRRKRSPGPRAKMLSFERIGPARRTLGREAKLVAARSAIRVKRATSTMRDVWVIGERRGASAEDTGYHFFKYLRTHHPDIPAYFIAREDAKGIAEARALGEVLPYGSVAAYRRLLEAKVLAYSDCGKDLFLHWPRIAPELRTDAIGCMLQHGVIGMSGMGAFYHKRNMLARKEKLDVFVVSSERELRHVHARLGFDEHEVAITGLSRFDALARSRGATPAGKTVVVMPTWRNWLKRRSGEAMLLSRYHRAWQALLSDPRLDRVLGAHDAKLVFCPHFGMAKHVGLLRSQSARVHVQDPGELRVQELLLGASVLVTDYSSVSFDFAYLGRPVLFYQFDPAEFFARQGACLLRADEMLGPVLPRADQVIDELDRVLARDGHMDEPYRARVASSFAFFDDQNSARIYQAICRRLR